MFKYLILSIILFCANFSLCQTNSILKEVNYKCFYKKKIIKKKGVKWINSQFTSLIQTDSLNKFNNSKRLYILYAYDIESGITYFTIWDSIHIVQAEVLKKRISFDSKLIIDDNVLKLISTWNIDEIHRLEGKYATLTSPFSFLVLKVETINNKYVIDCLNFEEF